MRSKNSRKDAMLTKPTAVPQQGNNTGFIPDVQASGDERRIAIDRVGVKDVTYPIRLLIPERHRAGFGAAEQTTIAQISMYVSLPHYQKGTHMSRFLEVLNDHPGPISPSEIPAICGAIRERLDAEEAYLRAEFTYFINKPAPVTGSRGLMDYRAGFECVSSRTGATDDFIISVQAPATSLCPCSKEISAYGAHNQRCLIEARVRFTGTVWIEDIAELAERSASCPVYAVLKRPDEKQVTEAAYDNPKFVEDIIRDLALAMEADARITWYQIESENFESIHNHNAYAQITREKRATGSTFSQVRGGLGEA